MYYRLSFAIHFAGSFLSTFYLDGMEVDERQFIAPRRIDEGHELSAGCEQSCRLHDVNLAASNLLVCKRPAAEALAALCGESIQLLPMSIVGQEPVDSSLFLVHLLEHVDCIDEKNSQFTRWTSSDHRSDLAGKFRMMVKLIIDDQRANGHMLFRPAGWEVAIIAHQRIVQEMANQKFSGVAFELVSKP